MHAAMPVVRCRDIPVSEVDVLLPSGRPTKHRALRSLAFVLKRRKACCAPLSRMFCRLAFRGCPCTCSPPAWRSWCGRYRQCRRNKRSRMPHLPGSRGAGAAGEGVTARDCAGVLQGPLAVVAVLFGFASPRLAAKCVWGRGPGDGCVELMLADLPRSAVPCCTGPQNCCPALPGAAASGAARGAGSADKPGVQVYPHTEGRCKHLLCALGMSLQFLRVAGARTFAFRRRMATEVLDFAMGRY